jgi:hypothetical protein
MSASSLRYAGFLSAPLAPFSQAGFLLYVLRHDCGFCYSRRFFESVNQGFEHPAARGIGDMVEGISHPIGSLPIMFFGMHVISPES